jgi:hypothetical protein
MAKKITNRSILGQRGINLIEEYVLAMGFAWHPTNQSVEAGIDGHIELRNPDSEQALNLVVAVQSKACTDFPSESDTTATYYCKEEDIEYWLSGNLPVMLIVSRPGTKDAYWVNISQHFRDHGNPSSRKVVFDKSRDRFDASVRARLFDHARPRDSGLYLAPLPKPELLMPNLLPVRFKGNSVFRVRSKFTDPKRVVDTFREANVRPERDWAMKGGVVLSFHNLDGEPWSQVLVPDTVESIPLPHFSETTDRDERNHFVQLLNRSLEVKLQRDRVWYERDRELYYFAPTDNLSTRKIGFQSIAQHSTRTVFEAYRHRETGDVRFCRHAAFHGYFRQFDGVWMLEVTPTYHFTRDGRNPDKFEADRLKGIKRLDRHRAVLGQLLAWIDFLTKPGKSLFQEAYAHFELARPDSFQTVLGIDDKNWLDSEDPEELVRLQSEEAPTGLLFI